MPLLGTRGAASARGFGMFGGKAPEPYWIGTLGGTGSEASYGVAVDSTNNVYMAGGSGSGNQLISKYNASGVIQWQKELQTASAGAYAVAVDSSSNVYCVGYDFVIAKYNSSGTLQFQKRLNTGIRLGRGIAVDSSGNIYVAGYSDAASTFDFQIYKYNSSATLQWQRRLGSDWDDRAFGIALDSSSNIYVAGYNSFGGSGTQGQIAKYNTSGTIQWQRQLSVFVILCGVAVDSSGNVYAAGSADSPGSGMFVCKYDTSGTLQWQKNLNFSSGSQQANCIAVSSSGDVYIGGYSNRAGTQDWMIAKYNTSGTLQWQRRLGSSSGPDEQCYGIAFNNGDIFASGVTNIATNYDFLFARLPADGSKTGTYTVGGNSFTYAASSLTNSTPSYTSSASSLTDAATSYTETTTSFTVANTTFTSSVTTI